MMALHGDRWTAAAKMDPPVSVKTLRNHITYALKKMGGGISTLQAYHRLRHPEETP